jgi:hypothetical protein
MKKVENQPLNIEALLGGSKGVKSKGLTGAGLSIGNSLEGVQAEDFLQTLKNIESPESQKQILSEIMNSNYHAKDALLSAMKGELIDTNVGDSLDQIKLERELKSQNLSPELKTLLQKMKKTEIDLSQEIDNTNKTGSSSTSSEIISALSSQKALSNINSEENTEISKVGNARLGDLNSNQKNQLFIGAKQADKMNPQLIKDIKLNNEMAALKAGVKGNDVQTVDTDPRIPLKLNLNQQQSKQGKVLASGADFVQNMNALSKNQNNIKNVFGKKTSNSNVKGYGKTQNTIKKSMFDLSGADFNTKGTIESDFGSKLQVEAVTQNNKNGGFEFLAANLDNQTPKGFDVINPNTKVLDMSNINSTNKMEIIDKIVNHIELNKLKSADSIDLIVKHDDIGNFRVNVSKTSNRQVDLEIMTQSGKGREFFVQNESDLIKSLDKSGVKLSNFKLVTGSSHAEFTKFSSESKNQGFDMGQHTSQEQSQSKQFQSSNRDSDRRRQLWEQYKEQAEDRRSA